MNVFSVFFNFCVVKKFIQNKTERAVQRHNASDKHEKRNIIGKATRVERSASSRGILHVSHLDVGADCLHLAERKAD